MLVAIIGSYHFSRHLNMTQKATARAKLLQPPALETAKLFMSGRSQAVRLPKSCRFEGVEVVAQRVGNSVVLSPVADDWSAAVQALFVAAEELPDLKRSPQSKPAARARLL
jgi:antitoxin VapB